jgi:Fe-Mn family superoxide dismutase
MREGFVQVTRREALAGLALAAPLAGAVFGGSAFAAEAAPAAKIAPGEHAPVPLPFDPTKLPGLSERLLVSHHDNNYAGAVKNLNAVELELAKVTRDTPSFLVGGLRERELTFANSMTLHELYFANLGGDGKPGGSVAKAISETFGSQARFEELFRATAMSLAGGSGWTVLDYSFHDGAVRIQWSGGHSQSLAFGAPLLVLDMYEHAYQMDYGAAAAKYLDAFGANVRWDEVSRRYDRAEQAAKLLRG